MVQEVEQGQETGGKSRAMNVNVLRETLQQVSQREKQVCRGRGFQRKATKNSKARTWVLGLVT